MIKTHKIFDFILLKNKDKFYISIQEEIFIFISSDKRIKRIFKNSDKFKEIFRINESLPC